MWEYPINTINPTGHFANFTALTAIAVYATELVLQPDFQYDISEIVTDIGRGQYGWLAVVVAMMAIHAISAAGTKRTVLLSKIKEKNILRT